MEFKGINVTDKIRGSTMTITISEDDDTQYASSPNELMQQTVFHRFFDMSETLYCYRRSISFQQAGGLRRKCRMMRANVYFDNSDPTNGTISPTVVTNEEVKTVRAPQTLFPVLSTHRHIVGSRMS